MSHCLQAVQPMFAIFKRRKLLERFPRLHAHDRCFDLLFSGIFIEKAKMK